jgi:competence protein ComEC
MNPKSKAPIWEHAPMFRLAIALMLGIVLFDNLNEYFLSALQVYVILAISFSLFAIFTWLSLGSNKYQRISNFFSLITLVGLGFGISFIQSQQEDPEWLNPKEASTKRLLAIVTEEPIVKKKTVKYKIRGLRAIGRQSATKTSGSAFIYVYQDSTNKRFENGDTLLLPNNWQPIANTGNPYELDYKRYCARKGIHVQQFLSPKEAILYSKRNSNTLSILEKTHQYCLSSIEEHIKDKTTAALLKALLVGDERDIDPNVREAYSDTGIIHIVSISGAHVAILFAAIMLLFGFIKNKKYEWLKFLFSLILIWFYVMLAGASTPALRAALMFSIFAIGTIAQHEKNPLNQLFATAFILLLFQPMWLFSLGFQLSFVAVLSLLIFYTPLISLYQSSNKVKRFFANAIAASIAAEILVAPLVAFYFHSFPPMFIIANVFASIAMSIILVLGIALLIIAKIKLVASALSTTIIFVSHVFHSVVALLQSINFPSLKTIFVTPFGLVLIYISIGALSIFFLQKRKKFIWISAVAMLLLSIIHLQRSWQINTQQKLIVFNQNKKMHAELLKGNTYQSLGEINTETFATKNTHIGFGATHKTERTSSDILVIDSTKIIFLDDNTRIPKRFPIDIIVIKSWAKPIDVPCLVKVFSPKKIIVSAGQSNYQTFVWTKQCNAAHIALHNTQTEGAFVYP